MGKKKLVFWVTKTWGFGKILKIDEDCWGQDGLRMWEHGIFFFGGGGELSLVKMAGQLNIPLWISFGT